MYYACNSYYFDSQTTPARQCSPLFHGHTCTTGGLLIDSRQPLSQRTPLHLTSPVDPRHPLVESISMGSRIVLGSSPNLWMTPTHTKRHGVW